MENRVFIDTWGWVTLRDKSELKHRSISRIFQELIKNKIKLFTSDYVLDETITLIFKRLPIETALEALEQIEFACSDSTISLLHVDIETFFKTLVMRKKFFDQPNISFTDFSSAILMSERKISKIITADAHFTHLGFSFELIN